MAYFGLVPGEQSSGETVWRGGITKTGNTHARRALVEGAWAYRMRPRIGRHKVDRIEALPKVVRVSAGKRKFDCAPDIVG
ncbi:transposase [Mesorhizobium sp. M0159]|uniref:transposase n=1 Tax=Mesorhizobium sp. M0159 TaxID=2956900 RepID=UPI00333C6DE0